MQLYPAIDIKDGRCVRLRQGAFDQVNIYSESPAEVARQWESQGATWLHLVDLDGAAAGRRVNAQVIREIASAVSMPIQLGGGIRSIQDMEAVFDCGIRRVIIGTKAVQNPGFVKEAISVFGADRIVVGVDAKNGFVATDGWEKVSTHTAVYTCLQMEQLGVKTSVYTDISRDGMMGGPNLSQTEELNRITGMDIIASGGVSSMMDLEALSRAGIHGAIIGKALYENKISLRQAVAQFQMPPTAE